MNDRYLYKAKRKHDSKFFEKGEWVEGAYYIEPYTDKLFIIQWNSTGLGFNEFIEVDEESVCQCTGLKDKNGKLIWENDVVKATVRQNSLCQSSSYSDFYQVAYHEKYCYFYLKKKNNNLLFDGNWSYYLKSIEVIGNIFDNPELLESEGSYGKDI